MTTSLTLIHCLLILLLNISLATSLNPNFDIKEATIKDLQAAFSQNELTSKELVQFYLEQIKKLNPVLRAVIEVNPDALTQAEEADMRRAKAKQQHNESSVGVGVDGIPILLKDNIATKDKLNTTAGSYALLGSVVPRDAGVVKRLREAGAIILGKASLSEWANFRSNGRAPSGWSARGGHGKNPYHLSVTPCGSSSGSAIAVAANMGAVSLGTETDGSILCPSALNSVVGIKPTVGLTSRGGVIPITPTQDTIGPICRTVADAAYVLESIVGYDPYDSESTTKATTYIPQGGYAQFLKLDGLQGKRIGIVRSPFFDQVKQLPILNTAYKQHFQTLRKKGAILVDNLKIPNIADNSERIVMLAEFKISLNSYIKQLIKSPVQSLADVIKFNNHYAQKEMIKEYGQNTFLEAQATNGIGTKEKKALATLARWSRDGFEKVIVENKLDAVVTPQSLFSSVLAIGGYPGISVPAGYDNKGVPFGICFGGLRGTEPKLIEIAYAFEQATLVRKPPTL